MSRAAKNMKASKNDYVASQKKRQIRVRKLPAYKSFSTTLKGLHERSLRKSWIYLKNKQDSDSI